MGDDTRHDGLADVINLLAAPLAGGLRTVDQMRRGVEELIRAIDNANRTMENINEAAMRANRLLADIEEPVRAMIPQITRTVRAADEITRLLESPVRATAPNLEKVVDALSSPGFATLPNQLGEFMNAIGDVSKRLGPLANLAENAGGLFGFKLPGMGGARPPVAVVVEPLPEQPTSTTRAATAKTSTAKASAAKKSAAKKSAAKKSAAKKSAAKKSAVKQSSGG